MNPRRPRVAVVYNAPVLPRDHPDRDAEGSVVAVAASVFAALTATGFEPVLLDAVPPLGSFIDELTTFAPDLVFNLVEAYAGDSAAEPYVASVFELLGVAYTGSSVEALSSCRSKGRTKALFRGLGLPTAQFAVVGFGEHVPAFDCVGPVIVKPDSEDASQGIDQQSVVRGPSSIADRVERLRSAYGGSVLIESYLPGPEYNVGVISDPDPTALPVARVVFADRPGVWPILTYDAKWDEGSAEDLASPVECPARVDAVLADRLCSLAVSAFRATGCRDYARVDFRLDGLGEPMILEVNPNPDLALGSGWARAARAAGLDYDDAVAAIALQALGRSMPPLNAAPLKAGRRTKLPTSRRDAHYN